MGLAAEEISVDRSQSVSIDEKEEKLTDRFIEASSTLRDERREHVTSEHHSKQLEAHTVYLEERLGKAQDDKYEYQRTTHIEKERNKRIPERLARIHGRLFCAPVFRCVTGADSHVSS